MKFKAVVEYEYPTEHKPPVKAEIVLHGDRVITDNIKWIGQEPVIRDNGVKDELEPITKNDKVDCEHTDCNNCVNHKYCDYEPTTKNNLGVDCISRADAIRVASGYCHPSNVANELAKLPSVTPQEPKSEWQQDHEILKAHSDGANEVLDKIRFDLFKLYNDRPSDYNHSQRTELFCEVIKILDKYTAGSAHDVAQEIVNNNGIVDL